jgi:putative ABC transport system substrate-binding protein
MKRRDFIALVGGAVASWPLAVRAQQPGQSRRIGALIGGGEGDTERQGWLKEFRGALLNAGWAEGRNLQIDWRFAAASRDRATALAEELIALKPNVLFGDNTFVMRALQDKTRTLPIVFAHVTNPVVSGFVVSLPHPGGNTTGFTDSEADSRTKLVELLKQMAPHVTRIATIGSQGQSPIGREVNEAIDRAITSLGLTNTIMDWNDATEIERGIVGFGSEPNGALVIPGDPVTTAHLKLILSVSERYRLPVVGGYRGLATEGGLASYGADVNEQYRGAAGYVDRILKGDNPSNLPVQQPTKYELRLNLRTAKALGLEVPLSLRQLADQVIE